MAASVPTFFISTSASTVAMVEEQTMQTFALAIKLLYTHHSQLPVIDWANQAM
jgi:hypothetical protein